MNRWLNVVAEVLSWLVACVFFIFGVYVSILVLEGIGLIRDVIVWQ